MQELFFRLGGLRWDSCVLNVIIFVSEKSITFKKRTYRRKTDKKPSLSDFTQTLCDLLSLLSKYF